MGHTIKLEKRTEYVFDYVRSDYHVELTEKFLKSIGVKDHDVWVEDKYDGTYAVYAEWITESQAEQCLFFEQENL